jgi:hypothetical protein
MTCCSTLVSWSLYISSLICSLEEISTMLFKCALSCLFSCFSLISWRLLSSASLLTWHYKSSS